MNTRIRYMYRDGANHIIQCEEVVKGEISKEICEDLFENHSAELEEFYPMTIGFKAPTFVAEGFKPYPNDPDTHEIKSIALTESGPTVNLSVEDFVARVKSGFISRPAFIETKFGIVLKKKNAAEGLSISEVTEMLNKLNLKGKILPLCIESKSSSACAFGFITDEAYEAIDYDIRVLEDFLEVRLFRENTTKDFCREYIFHGIQTHISV